MLFLAANGFYENGLETARKINASMRNESFKISPVAAVNLSFSAELFLKLIFLLEYKETIHDHRLDEIFKGLPPELRIEIENKYILNVKSSQNDLYPVRILFNAHYQNPDHRKDHNDIRNLTLINLLKIHGSGFVNWRYAYEKKDFYYSYEFNFNLMNEFIKSLIAIIELRYKDKLLLL